MLSSHRLPFLCFQRPCCLWDPNPECQGREESHTAYEPPSAHQHSPSRHKPVLTRNQAETVPILTDFNRELKLPGNRKDESTCFSEKVMELGIESTLFLEGMGEETRRLSLPTAVLIVQGILQGEVLWPAPYEGLRWDCDSSCWPQNMHPSLSNENGKELQNVCKIIGIWDLKRCLFSAEPDL